MAERIDKTVLNSLVSLDQRVEASEDATHGQKQNAPEDEEGSDEAAKDRFRKKTDSDSLAPLQKLEKAGLTQQIELAEIEKAWFGEISMQTDPSILFCKIQLKSDPVVYAIKAPLSRGRALALNACKPDQILDLKTVFADRFIWVQIVKMLSPDDDEVTRIAEASSADATLSETFKMQPEHTLWRRLGVVDKRTHKINFEVLLAYITVFLVTGFLLFGLIYLAS